MKSMSCLILLFSLFSLAGCNELADEHCSLPVGSEWTFVDGDISFKVKNDSLFWKMNSDAKGIPSLIIPAKCKLLRSGRITLQNHLSLLSQDLAYVCGSKVADVYQCLINVHQYKLKYDKLTLYSSDFDSIIFYRKK